MWFQAVPAGEEASDFRVQTYDGQPVLTWWQGTGLGGLSTGTDYIYNDHYQQIATVNAGNGLSADGHEFLITPWNTALILSYTTATGEPHVDRRPGRPDGDQRRRAGDRHRHRQGAVPVEQRGPRAVQPERAAAAGLGEHAVGLVPHQRRQARHRRQPADRRPRHVDDLQGQPADREHHLAARRQGLELQARRRRPGRCSTARARSSPGSTIRRRWATACTRSSTTSPPVRRCSPTAARSR